MKSRTSFFNLTVFRKNITRFAPVWALYTIFMLLFLFTASGSRQATFARELTQIMGPMVWVNFFYAGICAFCLFGDLFNSRLCNALHAFPLRREGWLLTGIADGMAFSLLPNLLVSLLTLVVLREYTYVAFIWLAVSTLQFIFFFGTAALSALCAGNRLAMIAIYGIIHFITVLIFGVWELFYQPLLYGVSLNFYDFYKYFPLSQLTAFKFLDYEYMSTKQLFIFKSFIGESWRYLGFCAGVGVVCLALAWLVYRHRQLESAGDFISLRYLSPVFLTIYTIGVGVVLYMFGELFNGSANLFLIVGLTVGFFTGRMLLGRTVRVFNKKSFIGFAVLLISFVVSMALTKLDPLGVASYIPDADDVQSVAVYDSGKSHIYESDYYSFSYTQKEEILQAQDLHKQLMAAGNPKEYDSVEMRIRYTLKNGRRITRYYRVILESEVGTQAKRLCSDLRYLFQVEDPATLYNTVTYIMADSSFDGDRQHIVSKDAVWIKGLLNAIQADSKEGTLGMQWKTNYIMENIYVEFQFLEENTKDEPGAEKERYPYCRINISEDCTNTYAYLKAAFALGKEDIP